MAEEIDFENGRNSNFEGVVTLTLTFDPAILHTVVHHSSTSTYIPNFIQIEETFCGRTDVRTYGRTDISPLYIIRSTLGSRPKYIWQHSDEDHPNRGVECKSGRKESLFSRNISLHRVLSTMRPSGVVNTVPPLLWQLSLELSTRVRRALLYYYGH